MISVVIPTFNRGYTLSQVLDSYYRQKFVEELIIVEDGGIRGRFYLIENRPVMERQLDRGQIFTLDIWDWETLYGVIDNKVDNIIL